MGLMKGKRGLIMGLANDKSLAWGIAKALHAQGAELAISYQGEVMEKRVKPLADQLGCDFLIDCDVSDMANLDQAFATLAARWPTIDFIVHAIGYTNKEALRGAYADVGLEDFLMTMNISVYSFTAVAKRAAAMMAPYDPETGQGGGAMLTLSYYGAEKVIPHYNVMGVAKSALETSVKYLANDYGPQGIRVNAICPSFASTPMVESMGDMMGERHGITREDAYSRIASRVPMRRVAEPREVVQAMLWIVSDANSFMTGQAISVDGGLTAV